jgi:hypothetical protein
MVQLGELVIIVEEILEVEVALEEDQSISSIRILILILVR